MLKLSPLALAVCLLAPLPYTLAQTPATAAVASAEAARIDALVNSYFPADMPGATLIVVRDGQSLLRKAYGLADVEHQQAMTPQASLRLGSITKQFTAVAIMMLVDQGKLSLADPVTTFFPDYPAQGRKVTIEHLLTHTSGIASFTGKPSYVPNMARDYSVREMIDGFKNDPLEFEPGTRYAYNNSGYFLLGAIIEKVSGMSYADFLAQRIFIPLGMDQTAYEGHERHPIVQRAHGYTRNHGKVEAAEALSMSQPYAAGALVSTVDDLARWNAAVTAGKLLTAASWRRVLTPYILADGKSTRYGYGWAIGTLRGVPDISHGGGINGFNTHAVSVPGEKVYVALLSNSDAPPVELELIANQAAAIAMGKPYPELKPIALDTATLDAYAGVYRIDEQATRTVRREGDHLLVGRTGGTLNPVQAYADNAFFTPKSLTRYEFRRNEKGEVAQLVLVRDGQETIHPRVGR
ncbi:serine hydrolase [Oxalobacteraceae bacterium A2-2]